MPPPLGSSPAAVKAAAVPSSGQFVVTTNVNTSSMNLQREWRLCCFKAMGLEQLLSWEDEDQAQPPPRPPPTLQIYSIVVGGSDEDESNTEEEKKDNGDSHEQTGASNNNNNNNIQNLDIWMQTACAIDDNLRRMQQFLQSKQWQYGSVHLPDAEALLIQSTVTSFVATTAQEIETLREMIAASSSSLSNSHVALHRTGIVQIIMEKLQRCIVQPFGRLQKQRKRTAVRLWQNPLECVLAQPPPKQIVNEEYDEEDDVDIAIQQALAGGSGAGANSAKDDKNNEAERRGLLRKQQFLPTRPSHRFQQTFLESYGASQQAAPQRPPSSMLTDMIRKHSAQKRSAEEAALTDDTEYEDDDDDVKRSQTVVSPTAGGAFRPKRPTPPPPAAALPPLAQHHHQQQHVDHEEQQQNYYSTQEDNDFLENEAHLLQATLVNSDLDSIQQMEQRMTAITSLLSQFANLVEMQQEEVAVIHQDTKEAKDNVQAGQEQLMMAKETIQESAHYMAKGITAMALLMLFFHLIKA